MAANLLQILDIIGRTLSPGYRTVMSGIEAQRAEQEKWAQNLALRREEIERGEKQHQEQMAQQRLSDLMGIMQATPERAEAPGAMTALFQAAQAADRPYLSQMLEQYVPQTQVPTGETLAPKAEKGKMGLAGAYRPEKKTIGVEKPKTGFFKSKYDTEWQQRYKSGMDIFGDPQQAAYFATFQKDPRELERTSTGDIVMIDRTRPELEPETVWENGEPSLAASKFITGADGYYHIIGMKKTKGRFVPFDHALPIRAGIDPSDIKAAGELQIKGLKFGLDKEKQIEKAVNDEMTRLIGGIEQLGLAGTAAQSLANYIAKEKYNELARLHNRTIDDKVDAGIIDMKLGASMKVSIKENLPKARELIIKMGMVESGTKFNPQTGQWDQELTQKERMALLKEITNNGTTEPFQTLVDAIVKEANVTKKEAGILAIRIFGGYLDDAFRGQIGEYSGADPVASWGLLTTVGADPAQPKYMRQLFPGYEGEDVGNISYVGLYKHYETNPPVEGVAGWSMARLKKEIADQGPKAKEAAVEIQKRVAEQQFGPKEEASPEITQAIRTAFSSLSADGLKRVIQQKPGSIEAEVAQELLEKITPRSSVGGVF